MLNGLVMKHTLAIKCVKYVGHVKYVGLLNIYDMYEWMGDMSKE
jgi:hypothetical protein